MLKVRDYLILLPMVVALVDDALLGIAKRHHKNMTRTIVVRELGYMPKSWEYDRVILVREEEEVLDRTVQMGWKSGGVGQSRFMGYKDIMKKKVTYYVR